jgi:hypothetical protein
VGPGGELGWVGCGPRGPTWPLGLVAGDTDRHRGWFICPSVPAAAGRGLRPRVFSAHRLVPQLQVQDSLMGRRPIVGIAYIQTGTGFLPIPFSQSCQVLCRFRLARQRKSGPRIALPAYRLYYPVDVTSVDHTGLLRRSAGCSVTTQRAHACSNGRPSDRLRFFMCGLVICGSSAGQSRRKKRLPSSRQRPTWLSACQ